MKKITLKDILTGGPRPVWIRYLFLIGFFSLVTRWVLDSRFSSTSLLYILVPYLVGLAIYLFLPPVPGTGKIVRFMRHLISSLIVMFCTSAILFEGIICVVMFMPIYLFFAALAYALGPKKTEEGTIDYSDTFKLSFAPLVILVLSVEGLTETTSFPRENQVTYRYVANLTPDDIHKNLVQPIHLKEGRSAFLSLFPLPDYIEAGTLNAGDVHKSFFTYKRWGPLSFNQNTLHKGETWLKIESVAPERITTTVIKDTSYFSHYLTVHGTEINVTPVSNTQTEIVLSIYYRRDLDPAWYFGPLQKRAMKESAEYLVKTVLIRENAP